MARPRTFAEDETLARLTDAFWARGYDGCSVQDLEEATGLNKQSLYRVWGDKRGMYLAALRAYERRMLAALEALEGTEPARARLGRIFDRAIRRAVEEGDRRGCFLCNAAVDQAPTCPRTGAQVRAMIGEIEAAFAAALAREMPDEAARAACARGLVAGYFGLRVLVKAGLPEPALRDAADAALAPLG